MESGKISKISNGITVVSHEINSVESATIGFWVKAGGFSEEKEVHGISHFLEHMAFKGTERRSARDIAEEIESVGGYLNAYTSRDVTAYHAKVLKDDIPLALDIVSDILFYPTFLSEEMERERGVILQEIGQSIDTPDDIIFDHFQNVAFPDQPMGRPILGTADIVSRLSTDDLRSYRAKNYTTDSIILSAAGNISHDKLVELAEKYVSNVPNSSRDKINISPSYEGGYYFDERLKLEQSHVILGFEGVKYTDPNYYTAALFSSILGEGMSSRLFQEVREKRGLVYSVYSFTSNYKDAGLFGMYAATSPSKVIELLDVAYDEVRKMRSGISTKEFNRTKAQFKSGLLMSLESTSSTCDQIASQTVLFDKPVHIHDVLNKIDAVTIDEIEAYTDQLLSSRPTLISVGAADCRSWYEAL